MEQQEPKMPLIIKGGIILKEWFKKTSKITLSFLIISLTVGITGLVIASVEAHKTVDLNYYLENDHTAIWGNTTIFSEDIGGKHKIALYFAKNKQHTNDVKWDGKYPDGYFND